MVPFKINDSEDHLPIRNRSISSNSKIILYNKKESISEFKDQSISNSHKLTNIIVDTVNQSKEKVLDNIQLSIDKKEDKSINEVQKK